MARKKLPDTAQLSESITNARDNISEHCEDVKTLFDAAAQMPSDLVEQMRDQLLTIARDAADAAHRLNTAARLARSRERIAAQLATDPSNATPTVKP